MRTLTLLVTIQILTAAAATANPPAPTPTTPISYSTASTWELPIPPPHLADRLWSLPFGGRVSWVTTAAPNPDARRAAARVFLLRGTGMVFSPEFGSLCTRLRQAGLWAEDLCAAGDHWVCERLIAEHRAGRLTGPVILVGHSRGGRHILTAARELEKAGITVDLLICLDVALPPAVPSNVVRAINVYLTDHRLYPASALTSARGSATRIENVDLNGPHSPIDARGLNHLNITASPAVQELVVDRILEVAGTAAAISAPGAPWPAHPFGVAPMTHLHDGIGIFTFASILALLAPPSQTAADPRPGAKPTASAYAEIRVVDAATGRGVPLVELVTVNHVRFVTDNAGRVAFNEPGLMNREVFFTVRSHGYAVKKDGFGFAGVRVVPKLGQVAVIKITRRNVAERLCRLTGEGGYRDTRLLGYPPPVAAAAHPGLVAGQDSVQAVRYQGELYWFWGDTARMSYPLGLFRTAGARTPAPPLEPTAGIAFDYFVDKTGFARAMLLLPERPEGVIWIDGVCTVPDGPGVEKLVAHYSRRKGLAEELEHGIAVFDDERKVFTPAKTLPLREKWRFPHGHPEPVEEGGKRWLLFGNPAHNVRVPATLQAVLDPGQYEAFTCATELKRGKPAAVRMSAEGQPDWRWQTELPPLDSGPEAELVKVGKLKPEQARFYPANAADPKERVRLHSGTVRWNGHRRRWVMIAGQLGGTTSLLGEVWYAEARQPTRPFATAVKIVTHDKRSFYNVCHHAFLDRDGGRVIHFEGTYTSDFSGNPDRTPRYDYNQVLYRLDLDHAALQAARVP